VVVTPELLQRVAAMPATRRHTAWGFRRRAALANMVIPREQQCYPRSVLPAEKFQQHGHDEERDDAEQHEALTEIVDRAYMGTPRSRR
jgi:hypothetical protein